MQPKWNPHFAYAKLLSKDEVRNNTRDRKCADFQFILFDYTPKEIILVIDRMRVFNKNKLVPQTTTLFKTLPKKCNVM